MRSLCLLRTAAHKHAKYKTFKSKLQCKMILLCRLHKYKNVILDSHCVYQNKTQLALKGNGRLDADWFIARYAQKPITH